MIQNGKGTSSSSFFFLSEITYIKLIRLESLLPSEELVFKKKVDDPNLYIELRENSQDSPSEVLFIIYYLLFIIH